MRVKKSKKPIIIGIVAVLLIIILVITNKKDDTVDYSNMTDEEISDGVQNKRDQVTVNNLAGLGERYSMEYYVASYSKDIEEGDYESPDEKLDEEFRKNYFPTIASFEEYAKTKFPKMFS